MDQRRFPEFDFTTEDGRRLALCDSRFDERQRLLGLELPKDATVWDYARLIDVVFLEPGFKVPRFVGMTVAELVDALRKARSPDSERFEAWIESLLSCLHPRFSKWPRIPDNHFSHELAPPPIVPVLPSTIQRLGLKKASVGQWLATLRATASKGTKPEELEVSGVLVRLANEPSEAVLTQKQVLALIDFRHVVPRLVCESRFGFATKAGWDECCRLVPEKEYRKRGLWGNAADGNRFVVRYRHRALGWSVVRCRYNDLFSPRGDWWLVLDDKGRTVQQPNTGIGSLEEAVAFAEESINRRFFQMGGNHALSKWERFSLPGGDGYRELLLQLDDWHGSYVPRHFRTRNVLVHVRTSVRKTQCGCRVLFLDEVQSDWHADLRAAAKGAIPSGNRPALPPEAPFRKEWPSLALKLMLWWAQRQGLDGVAWSTPGMQAARWRGYGPPDALYRSVLPSAAREIAKALSIEDETAVISVRNGSRRVAPSEAGWVVRNGAGIQVTKPFRHRKQAETFADLTGTVVDVEVPVLWLGDLPSIRSIPLYGVATRDFWLANSSGSSRGMHRYFAGALDLEVAATR